MNVPDEFRRRLAAQVLDAPPRKPARIELPLAIIILICIAFAGLMLGGLH